MWNEAKLKLEQYQWREQVSEGLSQMQEHKNGSEMCKDLEGKVGRMKKQKI